MPRTKPIAEGAIPDPAAAWPATAIKYIRRLEELIGAPVAMLSTSPERDDTVLVRDPFED